MTGIVYLIQPTEYLKTNVYKIGYSKQDNIKRCTNGYSKGSNYLCILHHPDPIACETMIIKEFTATYELFHGREYFKVNIDKLDLVRHFSSIVYDNIAEITKLNDAEDVIDVDTDVVEAIEADKNAKIANVKNSKMTKTIGNERYQCKCCYYMTENVYNMTRHSKTDKHIKAAKLSNMDISDQISKIKIYNCRTCDLEFQDCKKRWRHEQKCKKENEDIPKKAHQSEKRDDVPKKIQQKQDDILENSDYDNIDNKILIKILHKYENIIDSLTNTNKT